MDEYFDKEKFTGRSEPPPRQTPPPPRQTPPRRPNRQDNSGWYSWPVIIILFSIGAWPIALALLFYNLFGEKNKRKNPSSTRESAVERAMRNAEAKADRAAARASTRTDEALRRAAAQVERTIDQAAKQVEQAGRSVPPPAAKARPVKEKAAKPPKQKKAKPEGVLLRIFGAICMFMAACISAQVFGDLFGGGYMDFEDFFVGLGFGVSGAAMFFRGQYLNRMSRRSQRYILAIGNVDAMPLDEIAKRVNRTPAKAAKELQKLIDKGYLGEDAYIDHERGYFLRFGATLEEEEEEVPVYEAPPAPTPKEAEEGYSGILRNIRHANDRIADPELSRKIDRLEQISALIFREVEEHPEKRNSIHTFFDYYLPTTQKLLDTYADFEETGVEGEHLRAAKERIEQTMDAIVGGFEHQLDQLYSSDAMDVVSDIKVMEAMLNRDTASAAKDFGYPEAPKVHPKTDGDSQQLTL